LSIANCRLWTADRLPPAYFKPEREKSALFLQKTKETLIDIFVSKVFCLCLLHDPKK